MIYINDGGVYSKYHTDDEGHLVCAKENGASSIILNDVSNEFDAIITPSGELHFIIQGIGGELIYLKKICDTWKKYNIFKSRSGIKKIHKLSLDYSEGKLCAFYIMEHDGNHLMVKHRFKSEYLYEEPEVVGICDARRDFCVCKDGNGETNLFYKDINGARKQLIFGKDYMHKSSSELSLDKDILQFKAMYIGGKIYAVYTISKQSGAAIAFCDIKNPESQKIISFVMTKTCSPEILCLNGNIIIQWEENSSVMQISSEDGVNFTKPRIAVSGGNFAKYRSIEKSDIICDSCAILNDRPYVYEKKQNKEMPRMNSYKKDITNDKAISPLILKLAEIENDINNMGKTLFTICEMLNGIKDFKKETDEGNFGFPKKEENNESQKSLGDVGEKNDENIKLFENTDIDAVLPEV